MIKRREAGQAIAELILVLPLLLLILLGCLDLGRAFWAWVALANGSREGARYGALFPMDEPGIVQRATEEIVAGGMSVKQLRVDVTAPPAVESGAPITVTSSYTLPVLTFALFGGQPLSIKATSQMPIIPDPIVPPSLGGP